MNEFNKANERIYELMTALFRMSDGRDIDVKPPCLVAHNGVLYAVRQGDCIPGTNIYPLVNSNGQ